MSIVVRTYTYRELVAQQWRYEPARTVVAVMAGSVAFLAIPLSAIAAFVVGFYLTTGSTSLLRVLVGAVASAALSPVGAIVWSKKPWKAVVVGRLRLYSRPPTRQDGTTQALVRDDDLETLWRVTERAQLYTGRVFTRLLASPEDAPELRNRVSIALSDALRRPGDGGAAGVARRALRDAGIRARLDGVDVS